MRDNGKSRKLCGGWEAGETRLGGCTGIIKHEWCSLALKKHKNLVCWPRFTGLALGLVVMLLNFFFFFNYSLFSQWKLRGFPTRRQGLFILPEFGGSLDRPHPAWTHRTFMPAPPSRANPTSAGQAQMWVIPPTQEFQLRGTSEGGVWDGLIRRKKRNQPKAVSRGLQGTVGSEER